jgi:hypothetical protein
MVGLGRVELPTNGLEKLISVLMRLLDSGSHTTLAITAIRITRDKAIYQHKIEKLSYLDSRQIEAQNGPFTGLLLHLEELFP